MASSFLLRKLTPSQQDSIHECLRLQPIDRKADKISKFRKGPSHDLSVRTPIDMFTIEFLTIDNTHPDWIEPSAPTESIKQKITHIRLPFRFACALVGKVVNQEIPHRTLLNTEGVKPKYAATLKEKQVQPALAALKQLQEFGTTTLRLPTGFGKTVLGIWLAYTIGLFPCILIESVPLATQWRDTIAFSIPELKDHVWIVGEAPPKSVSIIICMTTRVHHLPKVFKDAVGTLLIDEAHLHCTVTGVEPLLSFTPKYTIALTATLTRNDGMEQMIHAICGVHDVLIKSIEPYNIIRFNTKVSVPTSSGSRGINFSALCTDLGKHEMRNLMIAQIILANMHRKFFIMSRRVDHVELLQKVLTSYGIECDTFYEKKKSYKDSHVLIGNVEKCGTGFDEKMKALDYGGRPSDTLILSMSIAGSYDVADKETTEDEKASAMALFEQVRGRVMRSSDPWIIYMVDSVKTIQNHWLGKRTWFAKTGGIVHEVDLNMHKPGCGIALPMPK